MGWKYNKLSNEETGRGLSLSSSLFAFYQQLEAFTHYLTHDVSFIKKSYLSQAKDIADKVKDCYTHQFTVEEQVLTRDYFKSFILECERLHKKLSS